MTTTFPPPTETRIIAVANQKGGVGKTTSTVNLGAALARHGARVLVVDMDPQGNASTSLGIEHHVEVPSIYEVLLDEKSINEVMQISPESENLFVVPATIDLAGAEIELVSALSRENRLKNALTASEKTFDYILIDCPPSLGLLTVNSLVAAKEVLIPIQCEYLALEGLSQLLGNIDKIRKHLNPELHISTVLLTMYHRSIRLASQVANDVRKHFPEQTLTTRIPRNVQVSESPSYQQTVIAYDPGCPGAVAYRKAARELAERGVQ